MSTRTAHDREANIHLHLHIDASNYTIFLVVEPQPAHMHVFVDPTALQYWSELYLLTHIILQEYVFSIVVSFG